MQKKIKIALGAGGGLVLLAAAGLAIAQQTHGPMAADLNGDGQITAQEITAAASARFAEADANKDGKLTGDEIPHRGGRRHGGGHEDGPPPPQAGGTAAPAQPQRPRMDANGDGAVTLAEFTEAFRSRLARADANNDGTISAQELAAAREHRRGHHRD